MFRVGVPVGILRREPLIGMLVPCKKLSRRERRRGLATVVSAQDAPRAFLKKAAGFPTPGRIILNF